MKTYVVFDTRTGKVVLIHTQAALSETPLPVSKESLAHIYSCLDLEAGLNDIDALEVEMGLLQQALNSRKDLYVDVENRVLRAS